MNITATLPDLRVDAELAWQRATETDCGVSECDRTFHSSDPQDLWLHCVATDEFDGGCCTIHLIQKSDGSRYVYVEMDFDVEMKSAELRLMATRYEKLPNLLRRFADAAEPRQRESDLTCWSV